MLRAALDVFVSLGDVHVRPTLRLVAALARATGRDAAAAALSATAGTSSADVLIDLLERAEADRRLAGLPVPPSAPLLREAIALARQELAAITERAGPDVEPAADVTPPPAVAAFRREGTVWTLTFDGTTVRFPDAKGLQDLATLLGQPGREVHCAELIGASVEASDTGPTLDTQARRGYQRRIVELQAELVEAEDAHDQGAADKARLEMDLLVEQLTAATGLGGRSRGSGSTHERARSTVGWRIRAAITRIAEAHPVLGRHLRGAVRTGAWCSYQPADPVRWQL